MRGNTAVAPHAEFTDVLTSRESLTKILITEKYTIFTSYWFIETVNITMRFFESTTTDPFTTICWQGTSPPSDKHLVCSHDCYNTKYEKSRILLPHLREAVYQHGLHNIHGCKARSVHHHHHQWTILVGIWIRCLSFVQFFCRCGKQIRPSQ